LAAMADMQAGEQSCFPEVVVGGAVGWEEDRYVGRQCSGYIWW
jgi:hypothetical protein